MDSCGDSGEGLQVQTAIEGIGRGSTAGDNVESCT
jgi:hypothetical protein